MWGFFDSEKFLPYNPNTLDDTAMSQALGTIITPTKNVEVLRQGETLMLSQGDLVRAGDVLLNKDSVAVDIELPSQTAGKADSLLTLAPGSSAQVNLGSTNSSGSEFLEVTGLSPGVELYSLGEGEQSAMMADASGSEMAAATSVSGLFGTGLLASSAGLGGMSMAGTAAAVVGGVTGLAAVAITSGDDTNTSNSAAPAPTEAPQNPDQPTPAPSEPGPGEAPTEAPSEAPPPAEPSGPTGTPLDALLGPVADALGGTPLAVVTDPLFDALGLLPLDMLPLDMLPLDSLPALPIGGGLPTDGLPLPGDLPLPI